MLNVTVKRDKYPPLFGGMGFHNNEAMLYPITEKEHFDQVLCKCYREIAPGFMRTFARFVNWTKQSMDAFADYYERMQKVTDTPMYLASAKGQIHFSEEEMEAYCENVADGLQYLKKERGMKHIRYYCFSNEMSQGGWGELMRDLPLFKRYHEMLYRAFQNRDLDIGLLATDASGYENWNTMDWAYENMSRITEDYCLHIYERGHGLEDLSFYQFFYDKCAEKTLKAIKRDNKRLILGEIGVQTKSHHLLFNPGVTIDACHYYSDPETCAYSALMLVEMAFAAINAGVYALAYWSFTDYPDPYSCAYSEKPGYAKTWGECEKFISGTTDSKYNKWGAFRWEDDGDYSPKSFWWGIAPMIKLFKRNSKVLTVDTGDDLLRSCALLNKDSSVSMGIVNRSTEPKEIKLDSDLFRKAVRVYEYDPYNVPYNRFGDLQETAAVLDPENLVYTLKPNSITFFTTDYQEKAKRVQAQNVVYQDGKLTWDAVADPNHCYYRVYAGDTKGFRPSAKNQIASTVACDLPADGKAYYKVLSVDQWGNV